MILGPSGTEIPIDISKVRQAPSPLFPISRQMKRAYLREVALVHINTHYGLEPRRIRRALALTLAKRSFFKAEVSQRVGTNL